MINFALQMHLFYYADTIVQLTNKANQAHAYFKMKTMRRTVVRGRAVVFGLLPVVAGGSHRNWKSSFIEVISQPNSILLALTSSFPFLFPLQFFFYLLIFLFHSLVFIHNSLLPIPSIYFNFFKIFLVVFLH